METQGNELKTKKIGKRPLIITVFCVLGFIGLIASIALLPTISKQKDIWYLVYLCVSMAIGLICMVGLWKMKRFGIIIYTILFGINQILAIIMGTWKFYTFIIPLSLIIIGFWYYKSMD